MKNAFIKKAVKDALGGILAGGILTLCFIGFIYFGYYQTEWSFILLALGFLLCILYGYEVFHIKSMTLLENKIIGIYDTAISLVSNIIGSFLTVAVFRIVSEQNYLNIAQSGFKSIVQLNYLQVLFFAIVTGFFIYFAYNTYKKAEQVAARYLVLFLCFLMITIFSPFALVSYTSGFYIMSFNGELIGRFFTIILGNILGTQVIPIYRLIRGKISA